jgi:mannose-6-phosphate isomerase-like protein (cupin superfamily)
MSAKDLASTFVVIGPDQSATQVAVTPAIYEELDRNFDGFRGRYLVAQYSFDGDWPTWEIHPKGDEVVVLLSGAADLVLDEGGKHRVVKLAKPGEFVVVPKATWHTARIATPTTMLFVTPGEGTENAVR